MDEEKVSVSLVHMNDASLWKNKHIKKAASASLSTLYKEKVRPWIDLIDSLRALGVENDLALPAIAVIGDQSSGKSSVLEALSGVALPRGSGIVTRCPLVLKLKKLPHKSNWKGAIQYSGKTCPLTSPSKVEAAVIKAQNELAGTGVGISRNLISLEISSPDVPDLTLIDLPGIARVAVDNQPQDIGQRIIALIKTYICKQETINLVVVPSNVDIATTEALKMAQEVDPQGERTLGILTKPDLIDKGTEQEVVNIIQNQRVPLRKGYMIVKCRGQNDINDKMSLEEAIEKEKIFFEAHPVFSCLLEEKKATIPLLAERLTEELIGHIIKLLPALENQIKDKLEAAHMELQKYGQGVPETMDEQMLYFIEKIQHFNKSISEKVEGQEILMDEQNPRMFARVRMCFNGWQNTVNGMALNVRDILKEELFDTKYRGKELPGFVNYRTFQEIVKTNIEMLLSPAIELLKKVADIVQQSFKKSANEKFNYFPHLRREVQFNIEDIITKQKEEATLMIKSQFDMERVVYCQDSIYSKDLNEVRNSTCSSSNAWKTSDQASRCSEKEMTSHLQAYYKNAATRIGTQIPMIIQTYILRDSAKKLQTAVLVLFQNKDQYDLLLQEEKSVAGMRTRVKEQISRLTKAQQYLAKFPILKGSGSQ